MTAVQDTFALLLREAGTAFAALADDLVDESSIVALLGELGIEVDAAPAAVSALSGGAAAVASGLAALESALDAGDDLGALLAAIDLAAETVALVDDVLAAGDALRASLTGSGAAPDATLERFGTLLRDRLLVRYLDAAWPAIADALRLLGVIVAAEEPQDPEAEDPEAATWTAVSLDLEALRDVIRDPVSLLERVWGFGAPDFDAEPLLDRMEIWMRRLGVATRRSVVESTDGYGGEADVPWLRLPVFRASGTLGEFEIGVEITPAPPTAGDAADAGLTVALEADGAAGAALPLADGVTLELRGGADTLAAATLELRPPAAVALDAGVAAGLELGATLSFRAVDGGSLTLLGGAGVFSLVADEVAFDLGLADDGGGLEPALALRFHGLSLALEGDGADSFLRDQFFGGGLDAAFDLELTWSPSRGFALGGAADFAVTLPVTLVIGPLEISDVTVGIGAGGDDLSLEVRLTVALDLSVFAFTADGLGLALPLRLADDGGNLGIAQLDPPTFVPPHGLGVSIDAGVVSGGGYIGIDADAGRYDGVLDVDLLSVGVTAIGVLLTVMPDGSDGWSLFLSLSATFTGVQLGFGFTLDGVGGLVGVNRAVDVEALGEGVRTGALDGILFPDDPVADAPRILSDIDAIFPPAGGQYVFGPVAKIGWGTPTLVEVDLGIVIQLPEPLTISLLGSLEAVLPADDVAVLELRIDVAGTLNVTEGTLSVDASLRDSRVAGLALSGDVAVRSSFIESPSFLMSFGGFNPHFTPPAAFPDLDRLSVALDTGDALRVELSGYFALTSNTVQFGSAADLWAQAIGLTVEGRFDFDALIQFKPFGFIVDLGFGVDVKAGETELLGVHLAVVLEGPNPWYVLGTATVKILGVKKDLRIEATIGDREIEGPAERVDVRALLIEALEDPGAWAEVPPAADAQAVSIGEGDPAETAVRVHPAGSLEVRQGVVPLERTLDHYGSAKLGGADRFELTDPLIGDAAASSSTVEDWFAPAQFFDMDDEEKLSAPSFEEMPCGLRLGDDGVDAGPAAPFELDYEQIVRDPDLEDEGRRLDLRFRPPVDALAAAIKRGPAARARAAAGLPVGTRPGSPFALAPARYVAADPSTGAVVDALTPAEGVSWSEAREAVLADASGEARLVVPAYELEEVA